MAAKSRAREPEVKMETCEEAEDSNPEEEEEETMEEEEFIVQIGSTYSCKRQDGTYHDAEVVKTRNNKRAGREEFYVHYIGLNCRQNEWVDKTRLVLVKPEEEEEEEEKEDDAANEIKLETSENGKEPQAKTEEEDEEPQVKKIKVDIHEAPANSSLVASEDFAEELTCPLCNELFKDPVVVRCGHNFCRSCIDKAWEGQDSFTCPDCKEVITDKSYTGNRVLANLLKKTTSAVVVAKMEVKEKPKPPANCLAHDERLKLFCKDDGDLGCVICRESLKHASHNFLPILDAMGVYRTELSSIVSPMEEALKVAEEMAKQQNEKIEKHKASMAEYSEHIETEFEKLHRHLREREEKLREKLQEEGGSLLTEMESNVAKIQENIDSIKQSISTASDKLEDTDSITFLTDIKVFINRCQDQQKDALSPSNAVIDKELNRETYKAPIQFSVVEEVKTTVAPKRKEIWIIGNFWVTQASHAAKKSACTNLGLESDRFAVRWMHKPTLMWRDLFPKLKQNSLSLGTPSVVFIHLGSSDLGIDSFFKFKYVVKRELSRLPKIYPDTAFIWSAVMPRRLWLNCHLEDYRNEFNLEVAVCAQESGIQVAWLGDVEEMCKRHFQKSVDSTYKLGEISDAFIASMKKSLETEIKRMATK